MIVTLILKNIIRNKKNSVIIILLIGSITLLFFTGNTIIGRSSYGLRRAYIESLTGEVVLEKKNDITMNLFGANTPVIDAYFTIPPLPAYEAVRSAAASEKGVRGITPLVSGKAVFEIFGYSGPVLLSGVQAPDYFSLFPGIILDEGSFLAEGGQGLMITSKRADEILRRTGRRPAAGDPVLLTSGSAAGFKIREVPLTGIYHYENPGQLMDEIVLADPQTVRILASIQIAAPDIDVPDEAVDLLGTDIDDLFGFDSIFSGGDFAGSTEDEGFGDFSVDVLESYLSENAAAETLLAAGGDWNFIILRLEDGIRASTVIRSLNKKLDSYGVTAVDWRIAAGNSAITALLIQALFNAGVFLVSVAGIIAAVNILLISVFKRTKEIGALRAIGAADSYICFLILGENIILSFIAGFAGIFAGLQLIGFINRLNITIPNALIASLLGGSVLRLSVFPGLAAVSCVVSVFLGFAASIYPVQAAVRIDPIVAVRQG
jgi:ABC-type lipoprotein release transport system permease subunit